MGWIARRFSRKLALAFCLTVVLIMGLTDMLLNRALRRQMENELAVGLAAQSRLIASGLRLQPIRRERLQGWAVDLARGCDCRVTLIDSVGAVTADSGMAPSRLPSAENHRGRPEVRSALAGTDGISIRRSGTTGDDFLYAAVPVTGKLGVDGVVRLAMPLTKVETRLSQVRRAMILIALAMFPPAIILALWMSRSASGPLSEISDVARRLAEGDFSARVQSLPVDEHRQLGRALNLMAERIQTDLERLNRLEQVRRDFVANVSHELRTPLASVKAFAETLSSGGIDDAENRHEFLAEIERSTDRMARLVDDLLALSALESGQRPPALEPVPLMRLAAEVVAALKPLAERRQIALRLEPFPDLPELRADRGQLKQVLTNLVDNAVKYTPEKGTVRIFAAAEAKAVSVSVQDTGCGIPAEHLPRIFERFYRVDKARSRELGGTGLGLAIVKHIVEAHGGSVSVESGPELGTTFRFTLPLPS